jgi:hypothetical protein
LSAPILTVNSAFRPSTMGTASSALTPEDNGEKTRAAPTADSTSQRDRKSVMASSFRKGLEHVQQKRSRQTPVPTDSRLAIEFCGTTKPLKPTNSNQPPQPTEHFHRLSNSRTDSEPRTQKHPSAPPAKLLVHAWIEHFDAIRRSKHHRKRSHTKAQRHEEVSDKEALIPTRTSFVPSCLCVRNQNPASSMNTRIWSASGMPIFSAAA